MKRIVAFLKNGLVLIAIVVVVAGVSVVLTLLRGEGGDGAAESPLATPAATVDVSDKIEPELLELVELEEERPGQGRGQAAWDVLFDEQGRVRVLIQIDRELIVVQPSETKGEPLGRQEAAQLIMAYGAEIVHEMEIVNMIAAYIPLGQIKALAQEQAVTHIWLSRISEGSPSPVTPDPLVLREGLLQEDPNVHIRADLLWNRGYAGEGIRVAFVDTRFDVEHPAFSSTDTYAFEIEHTQRDGGARG
jgi:hypothetical protein